MVFKKDGILKKGEEHGTEQNQHPLHMEASKIIVGALLT
jgi:hypothetical protein